jgi:hypothetical protein
MVLMRVILSQDILGICLILSAGSNTSEKQVVDPTGTGKDGLGYNFKDELPVQRSCNSGNVAMAKSGSNTNSFTGSVSGRSIYE